MALSFLVPVTIPVAVQAAAAKIPYSAAAVDGALAKGCSVFLEFSASW
jgi:hypothetical protein